MYNLLITFLGGFLVSLNNFKDGKYYESDNKEVGIILFHAYTGSPNDVNLVARDLNRQGFGILAPKFEGHGTKDVNDILDADMSTWQEQAIEAVRLMQAEYEKVFVFGLSLGGVFATCLMTQPELNIDAGGVFNSPVYTEDPVDVEVHFVGYVKALYKRFYSDEAYEADIETLLAKHRRQMEQLEQFKASFAPKLTQIKQPFYIAQSGKDEMIISSDAERLKEALINATVDLHWFPNNTHVITVNRNREEFEASLLAFIENNK